MLGSHLDEQVLQLIFVLLQNQMKVDNFKCMWQILRVDQFNIKTDHLGKADLLCIAVLDCFVLIVAGESWAELKCLLRFDIEPSDVAAHLIASIFMGQASSIRKSWTS